VGDAGRDEDAVLVARAQSGDEQAFAQLVRKYQHRAVTIARALVPHPADAEDVAQEAFLRAFRGLARFRGASTFRTWLVQIVTNTARSHRRRHVGRHETSADAADVSFFETMAAPGTVEGAAIARDRVARALAYLPRDLREAVVLRDIEGLDYREIADALGVPIGTVESRIFRGRARLRAALAGSAPPLAGDDRRR
jgi:RNA polymerase sigma-70 factor (ECF subfamily)